MELMHSHGAADTDVLITFEDFLAGKCGAREAVLAQKQIARLPEEPERPPESITRVEIDDLGYDMRVGTQLAWFVQLLMSIACWHRHHVLKDGDMLIREPSWQAQKGDSRLRGK